MPASQRWVGKNVLLPAYCWHFSWAHAPAVMVKQAAWFVRAAHGKTEEQLTRRVLIPPMIGLEDSSRHYSFAMVLDHLATVGNRTIHIVVELGRPVLYWAALFQAFDAVQFISSGALRGAGDTRVPMYIVLGAAWFMFLPLAYLFGTVLDEGVVGAWAGATLYIVVIGVAMFLRLKTERWRKIRI